MFSSSGLHFRMVFLVKFYLINGALEFTMWYVMKSMSAKRPVLLCFYGSNHLISLFKLLYLHGVVNFSTLSLA